MGVCVCVREREREREMPILAWQRDEPVKGIESRRRGLEQCTGRGEGSGERPRVSEKRNSQIFFTYTKDKI
jgi:hypothetical protein